MKRIQFRRGPSAARTSKIPSAGEPYFDLEARSLFIGDGATTGGISIGGGSAHSILNGSGVPASGLGSDGEFYIDSTAHVIYGPKSAGAWGAGTNLIGPAGTNGVNGSTWREGAGVPADGSGADGDYYLRTSNGAVYQRSAGTYAQIANLTGPAGAAGTNGTNGTNGSNGTNGAVGTFLVTDNEASRLLLGGSNPPYGSTVLQRDTLHVWQLLVPAHPERASSWLDLGLPGATVLYSETNPGLTGTPIPAFSSSFSDHGALVYATGDGLWTLSPPLVDSSGVLQIGALGVENLVTLALPAGVPLAGLLTIGDPTQGALPPTAPGLTSLLLEGNSLSVLNLWNLVSLTNVTASGCTALSAITFTNNNRISSLAADGCALSQSAVDAILAALGIEGGAPTVNGGTVNLGGGSSASPSTTTEVTRLVSQGWTVVTN